MAKRGQWAGVVVALVLGALGAGSGHTADLDVVVGASNGVLRDLQGINIGPLGTGAAGNPALTSAYQGLGIRRIRTHDFYDPLDMATLYPDRSKNPDDLASFNFTGKVGGDLRSSDEVFEAMVNNGFEPFFRLGEKYNNAKPPTDAERPNWVKAAVNVLKHYRQGQWNGYRSDFRFVEIGNEPDNSIFWPSPATPLQFYQLYDETAKALRSAFPELKLGGPGVTPGGCQSDRGKRWVSGFLDYVVQQASPMDYFSWHVYSNDPSTYATCATYFRQQLDSRGLTQMPMVVSEWNTSAEGDVTAAEALEVRTKARGAAILSRGWMAMQQRDDISDALFYRGPDPSMNAPTFFGIYYANGQPKKVALAWSLWNELFQSATERLATTGSHADVDVLVAKKANGDIQLLIANSGSTARSWSLALPAGRSLLGVPLGVKTVSDSSATVAPSTLTLTAASTNLNLPGYSVQLLTIPAVVEQAFAATGTLTGPGNIRSLSGQLTVATADVGAEGQVFLIGLLGGRFYAHNGQTWVAVTGSTVPAWRTGTLLATETVPVFSGLDVRGLAGLSVFLGYGRDLNDLLARGLYRPIATFAGS